MTRVRLARIVVAVACATLAGACESRSHKPSRRAGLQSVSMPDFSTMENSVRDQMGARYSLLARQIEHPGTGDVDLGAAYGELGKLLMAASYFDAAEPCYFNAQTLAPADARWPYYLGHLYKAKGSLEKSVVAPTAYRARRAAGRPEASTTRPASCSNRRRRIPRPSPTCGTRRRTRACPS